MPYRRPVTKRLTEQERLEIARLDDDIAALMLELGGKLCECGLVAMPDRCWTCTTTK